VAPANENEKKHAYKLLDKTLEATRGRVKKLVADSQYSSGRLREKISAHGVDAVILTLQISVQERKSCCV
jgi:hypothetical protein